MKRILALLLAAVLALTLVMPVAAAPAQDAEGELPYVDLYNMGAGTPEEMEAIFQHGAKSVMVGDYLLQADEYTGNFRITNTKTGQKIDSLPAYFTEGIDSVFDYNTRADLFSDLKMTYYFSSEKAFAQVDAGGSAGIGSDSNIKQTANSFEHSVAKGQLEIEVLDNGFIFNYGFNEIDTVVMPLIFPEEDWLKWIEKVEDPAVREEFEILYEPYDFKEIRSQMAYWDKMQKNDRNNDEYKSEYSAWQRKASVCITYPGVKDLYNNGDNGVYYIYHQTLGCNSNTRNHVVEVWEEAGMTVEDYFDICERLGGYSNIFSVGGCTVPVRITADEQGLISYTILNEEITAGPGYYINYLESARYMTASFADQEGYTVVPSGCGAIIDNDAAGTLMKDVYYAIGGTDNARSQSGGIPYRETNILPLYGVVRDNEVVTAIIDKGYTAAQVHVEIDYPLASKRVNRTSVVFEMTPYDQTKVNGISSSEGGQQGFQLFPRQIVNGLSYGLLPKGEYTVNFTFTIEENPGYDKVANTYRAYLIGKGMQQTADVEEDIPLMLDFYGCIDKAVLFLGIPFEVKYALTDFEQAMEIMDYLKNECGVQDMDLRYLGWTNGGVYSTAPSKIKPVNKLGGTKGLAELTAYMEENAYGFYPDVNLVTVYRDEWFDGFKPNKMTSKRIDFVHAILHGVDYVMGQTLSGWQSRYVISPRYYEDIFEDFRSEISKKLPEIKSYSFSENGKTVSGDYTLDEYIYTNEAVELVNGFMSSFKADGYDIATEKGVSNMLPYVSTVFRLPMTSSKLLIETEQIPLAQMVIHGSIEYCGESINEYQNDKEYVLKCLEYGALPYAVLMYAPDTDLKDTILMDLYSLNYKDWTDSIRDVYAQVNGVLAELQDERIVAHAVVAEDVNVTTYGNGTQIVCNYGETDYTYNGTVVKSIGFAVIK